MGTERYNGMADAYDALVDVHAPYYAVAADALGRHLRNGPGRCLDLGCGGGHFTGVAVGLGWTVVAVDGSEDQLRVARRRLPEVELVCADAADLPFDDESFDTAYSRFTHTEFDDFAAAIAEVRRVLREGGRFVYVGNHPCFVGAAQEQRPSDMSRLHPGYRRSGRWNAADAPGATQEGWRVRLGSFVDLTLADFLNAFTGFTLEEAEELDDGFDYPKTFALTVRRA